MTPDTSLAGFFEALENRAGTTLPRPASDGCLSLAFGDEGEITLEHGEDSPWIHLHAIVGTLPTSTSSPDDYRRLLEKNFPGGPLRGASLSMEPDSENVVLSLSLWVGALSPETFCNAVTNFAVTASECRRDNF